MAAALLASVLCSSPAPAAAPEDPLRGEALEADAVLLRRTLLELHAGLFRYMTRSEFDRAYSRFEKRIARDQPLGEAYLEFARFAALVRCGHTHANFVNQPRAIREALFESTPRLPFHFDWLGSRMIVTRDLTPDAALPAGTEILRIDGRNTPTILQRLLPLARADGGNDAKRIVQLSIQGTGRYEAFDVFFPLVFDLSHGTVKLDVRTSDGSRSRVVVATLRHADRIARLPVRTDADTPVFDWQDRSDGIAHLRMPTWALYDSKWDWRGWLERRLDALIERDAPALVIDLRGNEGGIGIGDVILQRLTDVAEESVAFHRLVRYRSVPQDLLPYLDTWDPSFKHWGARAIELRDPWPTAPPVHYYALADEHSTSDRAPPPKRFAGRVFVIVDASNSSATFEFAQAVQRLRLGTLVGEPTGGNQRGINGGAYFFLRLPRSGIEIDIPLVGYFPREWAPDAGLTPDVRIQRTPQDVASGRDVALEEILRMLEAK